MKKLKDEIVSFFNDKPVAAMIVLACFMLSFCATFTGFLDLITQASEPTPFDIFVAFVFTFIVQFCVCYFATLSWQMRLVRYYLALFFTVSVSVMFGWGFYFNVLGLDKSLASQTYTVEFNKIRNGILSNKANASNLADDVSALVLHSQNMVEKESRGEHT